MRLIQILVSKEKPQIVTGLSISALFVLTVFVFGPLQMFLGNLKDIPYSFISICIGIGIIGIILFLILVFFLLLLPKRLFFPVAIVIFLISVLFWFEGNIFIVDYGLLTGADIDWEAYIPIQVVDMAIWFIVLSIGIFFRNKIVSFIPLLCVGLICIQVIGLGFFVFDHNISDDDIYANTNPVNEQLFTFSKEKNVVLIILDTMGPDIFQKVLDEEPEIIRNFDGFIWYPNTTTGYSTTEFAIPYMLSDIWYENSQPYSEYMRIVFANDSIIHELLKNNISIKMSGSLYGITKYSPPKMNNLDENDFFSQYFSGSIEIIHMIPFRFFPHTIKKYFVYMPFIGLSESEGHIDLTFNKELNKTFNIVPQGKQMKIYHLWASHSPYVYDDNLQIAESSCIKQSTGAIRIVVNLLSHMRDNGIYNNTAIIISADHGSVETSGIGYKNVSFVKENARTVLLIKPFNSTGVLQKNVSCISIGQIPHTITYFFNMDSGFFDDNKSILQSNRNERRFLFYSWTKDFCNWTIDYAPRLQEYYIYGDSNRTSNYIRTGINYYPNSPDLQTYTNGISDIENLTYHIGDTINFTHDNSLRYIKNGWGSSETTGRLTKSYNASLEFNLDEIPGRVFFTMNASAFTYPGLDNQTVLISINDKSISNPVIIDSQIQNVTLPVPSGYLVNGTNTITIDLPDAKSPKSLGLSDDDRLLGIAVRTITLNTFSPDEYQIGSVISFIEGGNCTLYTSKGWSITEPAHTWTDGNEATLHLFIDTIPDSAFFTMNASAFTCPGISNQTVLIAVNNKKISDPIIMNNRIQNIILPIPSEILVNGTNTFTIKLPNATSPKSLGLSEDTRDLGIAVRTVALTTSPPDEYNIGDIIQFDNGGNSAHYLSKGWSITESAYTWTDGNEATLHLFIDTIPDSAFFTMNASAFTCPGISNQTVLIAVNNKKISDPIVLNNQIQNIILPIPSEFLVNGTNSFTINLPNATSPKSLGFSEDTRDLGIAVKTVALTSFPS